jgi:hypothetical protein
MATTAGKDSAAAPKPKRGRPKGKRGMGDNGPTEDDLRIAAKQLIEINLKVDEIHKARSTIRKTIKASGIELGVLDRTIEMLDWAPSEVRAHFMRSTTYARAFNLPAGDLLDLFEPREDGDDPEFEARKWYNVGKKDGLTGRGWPDEPPEGCPPECAAEYARGSEDGQNELLRAIKLRGQVVASPTAATLDPEPAEDPGEPTADETEFAEAE